GVDAGDGQLDPPLVAEVEHVGDLLTGLETEVAEPHPGAPRLRVAELACVAGIGELDPAARPVHTVQPERVQVVVCPTERVLEGQVQVGERLVAANGHAPADAFHPGEPGTEDEDMTRTAGHLRRRYAHPRTDRAQRTAVRVKTRIAADVMRTAKAETTARLSPTIAAVLCMPQMSCRALGSCKSPQRIRASAC